MADADEPGNGGGGPAIDPASVALAVFFVAMIVLVAGLLIFQTL
jgi:preprotein translocase subunit Sec61beta